ncbi:MAG: hypothetical protein NTU53_17575 [Planctomycetota bacterium]|nr:hypothetical protein [Planctomycetota bacterium]
MNFVLQPWQLLVVILTGWLNRQQQAAIDFTTVEVWTPKGLVTYYLLFVMEVAIPCTDESGLPGDRRIAQPRC